MQRRINLFAKTSYMEYTDGRETDLWRRYDGESVHDTVGILFTDLADEQSAHAGPGPAT